MSPPLVALLCILFAQAGTASFQTIEGTQRGQAALEACSPSQELPWVTDSFSLRRKIGMGIFFTAHQPVVPEIQSAIRIALMVDPNTLSNVDQEAAERTLSIINATGPQFNPGRFLAAVLISGALLWGAIWTEQHNLHDISRALMNSFAGFSGIVLGLLGGEAQKFSAT